MILKSFAQLTALGDITELMKALSEMNILDEIRLGVRDRAKGFRSARC